MSHDQERLPELLVTFSIKGRDFDLAECSGRPRRDTNLDSAT